MRRIRKDGTYEQFEREFIEDFSRQLAYEALPGWLRANLGEAKLLPMLGRPEIPDSALGYMPFKDNIIKDNILIKLFGRLKK